MIICSKCGAANGYGAVECRMCASRLTEPGGASLEGVGMESLNTTVVFANINTRPGTSGLTECLICPECQTINNIGWLFCPQCGKKVDTSFMSTMELADQAPTIAAILFPDQAPALSPLETAVPETESKDGLPGVENREEAQSIPPQPEQWSLEPQSPKSEQWSLEPQPQQQFQSSAEQPRQQPSQEAGAFDNGSNGAADRGPTPAPAVEPKSIACSECGSDNNADYFFCHSCGASLPVTKTIVMASIASTVKPRLRLLLPDGEPGPVYDIKNEARIGRTEGNITFPQDPFLSSSHARVVKRGADFILIDEASSNGTFLKVKRETKLEAGDVILAGGQLLRFEP